MAFWQKIRCRFTKYNKNNFYYKICIGVIFLILCFIRYLNKNKFIYIFFFHLQQGRIVLLLVLAMLCCIFKCRIKSRKRRRILSTALLVCTGLKWFVFSETVWPVYITSPKETNTFVITEEMMGPEKGYPVFYSREKFGFGHIFACQIYGMELKRPFSQWEYSYRWLDENKLEIVLFKGWFSSRDNDSKVVFDFNNKNGFPVDVEDLYVPKTDSVEKQNE